MPWGGLSIAFKAREETQPLFGAAEIAQINHLLSNAKPT